MNGGVFARLNAGALESKRFYLILAPPSRPVAHCVKLRESCVMLRLRPPAIPLNHCKPPAKSQRRRRNAPFLQVRVAARVRYGSGLGSRRAESGAVWGLRIPEPESGCN